MEVATKYVVPGLVAVLVVAAIALGTQDMAALSLFAWLGAAAALCGLAILHSTRLGVLLTAIGCFASNAYLLSRKWADHAAPSFCSLSEKVNCDVVNASDYSELFGIPITLLGAGFYAGLALAALGNTKTSPRFHQVNTLFATVALAYSAYLGLASLSMGVLCPLCISIYAGNLLLFLAGLKGLREADVQLFEDLGAALGSRSFLLVSGVFLVVVLGGTVSWTGGEQRNTLAELYAEPLGDVALDGTEPVLGDPDAPYLVLEFADFGCPHCATASRDFKYMVEENPDVQVRFRVFPLSGACNPALEGESGIERCVAAMAAECAHQQGRFWPMAELMFANQSHLAGPDLEFMAEQVNLDMAAWETCMQDDATLRAVVEDATAGAVAGVHGTPALFLRGTHAGQFVLVTWTPADLLKLVKAHRSGATLPPPGPPPPMN